MDIAVGPVGRVGVVALPDDDRGPLSRKGYRPVRYHITSIKMISGSPPDNRCGIGHEGILLTDGRTPGEDAEAGSPGRGTRAAGTRFTIAFNARPVMKAKALQGSMTY